jgi:hypothetical protein
MASLRRDELDERFPGLLDSVLRPTTTQAGQSTIRAARDST